MIRENTEGKYSGQDGCTHNGCDWEVGTGKLHLIDLSVLHN